VSIGAVILAAGFGTRLAPLTDNTPKPLLTVGGRPVISHLVDLLSTIDHLTEIVVVVNGRHPTQWQHWQADVAATPKVHVVSNGVTSEQARVGAVADLATAVGALGAVDTIVVLAGDNLIDEPLQPHVDAAVATGHPIVLCRDLGDAVPGGRFGEITTDDTGMITRFREKPEQPESPLAATCSYVLPGSVGRELASYLTEGNPDSPGSFVAWLAAKQPVVARRLTGRYFDIGNHETLASARAAFD